MTAHFHQPVAPIRRPGLAARVLVAPIAVYRRFVSPLLGPRCRFYPTCSAYAVQALQQHGAVKGLWLAVRRLLRCHPWNPGGYDPVPPAGPGAGTQTTPATDSAAPTLGAPRC